MNDISQQMVKARAQLVMQHPFFASIVLSIPIHEDTTCSTMWTDGRQMGYNPEWFNALPVPEAVGVLAHEATHVMSLHHVRRQSRNAKKWNVAADCVVNDLLTQQGFTLPKGGMNLPGAGGRTTEEVYSSLPDMPEGKGGGGEGGSDPGGWGEVRDAGSSPADLKRAEEETKVLVQQAANAARMMGKLPAGFDRLIGEIMEAQIDWRDYMRDFAKQIARDDYSWMRPNRRHIADGVYLPALHSEKVGEVCIFVDTSGSIGQQELDAFAGELNGVLHQVSPSEVIVLYVDSMVAHVERFKPDQWPVTLSPKGGGGTDFRPPFEWVAENMMAPPECAVYLTDLCGRFPESAPEYPVLWLSTVKEAKAPWGETVYLKTREEV